MTIRKDERAALVEQACRCDAGKFIELLRNYASDNDAVNAIKKGLKLAEGICAVPNRSRRKLQREHGLGSAFPSETRQKQQALKDFLTHTGPFTLGNHPSNDQTLAAMQKRIDELEKQLKAKPPVPK